MIAIKKLTDKNGKPIIQVITPYLPEFVTFARKKNGTFHTPSKSWIFDARDDETVREKCIELFGTDGSFSPLTVDVELNLDDARIGYVKDIFRFGRFIVGRRERDHYVTLGDQVVIKEGGFPPRGGSMKYPAIEAQEGTVLEIRDVPVSLVTEGEGVSIVRVQEPPVVTKSSFTEQEIRDALQSEGLEIEIVEQVIRSLKE